MVTDPSASNSESVTRVGLVEALVYVGLTLGLVGAIASIYEHVDVLAWWARALIDGAFVVVAAVFFLIFARGLRSAARDRGVATSVAVFCVALGVIAAEILGGSGVLANQLVGPDGVALGVPDLSGAAAAGALLTSLLLIVALARWRNQLLVVLLILSTAVSAVRAVTALQYSAADRWVSITIGAVVGVVLFAASLLPRLRDSDHADLLRLVGTLWLSLAFASAPGVWTGLLSLLVALAILVVASRRRMYSRGALAGAVVASAISAIALVSSQVTDTVAGPLVLMGVGIALFVLMLLLAFMTQTRVPGALSPVAPTAMPMDVLPPPAVASSTFAMAPESATSDAALAVVEPDQIAPAAHAQVAAATVEAPVELPLGSAVQTELPASDLSLAEPAKPKRRSKAEVAAAADGPEPEALIEPAAPAPAEAQAVAADTPPVAAATTPAAAAAETPPSGATISEDKHYWWDVAGNAWKPVPVSEDGFYYYDGSAWQLRPGR